MRTIGPLSFFVGCGLLLFGARLEAGRGVWSTHGPVIGPITVLAVDPGNPGTLYSGSAHGPDLFRSTDSGSSWARVSRVPGSLALGVYASAIAVAPTSPATLYLGVGGDGFYTFVGYVFKSTDGGDTWIEADNGLLGTMVVALLVAPSAPNTLYASFLSPQPPGAGNARSTDGGATWTTLPGSHQLLAVDPTNPMAVYGSASNQVMKSTDGGLNWATLDTGLQALNLLAVAVDPLRPGTVYAGYSSTAGTIGIQGGVLKSTDAGATWSQVTNPAGCAVNSIAVDPIREGTVYLTETPGCIEVLRSLDGGSSWRRLDAGLPDFVTTPPGPILIDSAGDSLHLGAPDSRIGFAGDPDHFNVYDLTFATPPACTADTYTLCLNGGRFQVQAQWTDFHGFTGLGQTVSGLPSADSGLFWFFSPDNWELLIKVLDGCGVNGHDWVFGAAATNVEYTFQVTDTQTGMVTSYTSPIGTASPAITDTSAFATCP